MAANNRENLKLRTIECPPAGSKGDHASMVFKDDNLSLYAVSILPEGTSEIVSNSHSLKRKSRSSSPGRRPLSQEPLSHCERVLQQSFCGTGEDGASGRKIPMDWDLHSTRLPPAPRSIGAVSYIGIGPVVRGKFDVDRAKEFGIFGPARAELTRGRSVLAKDGVTLVTPDMCIGPSTPASVGIVLSLRRIFQFSRPGVLRFVLGVHVCGLSRYDVHPWDSRLLAPSCRGPIQECNF